MSINQPSFREFGGPPGPLQTQILLVMSDAISSLSDTDLAVLVAARAPLMAGRCDPPSILGALSGMRGDNRAWVKRQGWHFYLTPKGHRLARLLKELNTMSKPKLPAGTVVTVQVTIDRLTSSYYVAKMPKRDFDADQRNIYFTDAEIADVISQPLQINDAVSVPPINNAYNGSRIAGLFQGTLTSGEGVILLSGGERIIRPMTDIQRS